MQESESHGGEIEKRFDSVRGSKTFQRIVEQYGLAQKKVLDIGCGYGEYLACFGKGSRGLTTTKEEVEVGNARGLFLTLGNAEDVNNLFKGVSFDAFWINNLFEHLLSPHEFLVKLKSVSGESSTLILGVPVVPRFPFLMRFSKWRGALASNHINFFTPRTLRLTVERAGWIVEEERSFFFGSTFLDRLTFPFAPHVYLVAKNNPNFSYPEKKIKEWKDDPRYGHLIDSAPPNKTDPTS